jgi:DNA polymerase sigma
MHPPAPLQPLPAAPPLHSIPLPPHLATAAATEQHPVQQPSLQGQQPSLLHREIEAFARRAAPLAAEAEAAQAAARIVAEAAREVWPACEVAPFGSQATSMSLPGSDVDIAVLGMAQPALGLKKCASSLVHQAADGGILSLQTQLEASRMRVVSNLRLGLARPDACESYTTCF